MVVMSQENQCLEWKESWRDDYLKWIAGFANANGGILYIGKNDKGKSVGLLNASLSSHPSKPANPDIANTFFRVGMIESWGRGISKIITECEQFNLPTPTYSSTFGGLMITFFSMVEMSGKMSGKILELIKKNPEITSSQLARKTRLTVRSVERNIKELRDQNKIERVGPGNGIHWKINE